jgi:hypothetical protein
MNISPRKLLEVGLIVIMVIIVSFLIPDSFSKFIFIGLGTALAVSLERNPRPQLKTVVDPGLNIESRPSTTYETPVEALSNAGSFSNAGESVVFYIQWLVAVIIGNVLWNVILIPYFYDSPFMQTSLGWLYDLVVAMLAALVVGVFQWAVINNQTRFGKDWILFTVVGYAIDRWLAYNLFTFINLSPDMWYSNLVYFGLDGLVVGFIQYLALRNKFRGSIAWMFAVMIGWSLSGTAEYLFFDHSTINSIIFAGLLCGIVEGVVTGLVMTIFVRSKTKLIAV